MYAYVSAIVIKRHSFIENKTHRFSFILFYNSDMYYIVTKYITKHKEKAISSPLLGL